MSASWPSAPPTRILSFQQMVSEADPFYTIDKNRPWIYEFSNGRRFLQVPDPYGGFSDIFTLDSSSLDGPDVLG